MRLRLLSGYCALDLEFVSFPELPDEMEGERFEPVLPVGGERNIRA